MRFSILSFLSLGSFAASFSFTGLPSSATVNTASSATLVRDSGDSTSFSLLLRLVEQNGGSTIKTFPSEQGTSIPFSFTPTQTGSFIIEVISNLQPISDTQQPDKIFASSSKFIVIAENDDAQSPPATTSTSDSENTSTSSLSSSDTASSTNPPSTQTAVGGNQKDTAQTSSTSSTSSAKGSSNGSPNGSSSTISSTSVFPSATTIGSPSSTGSGSGQGALATGSTPGSISTSSSDSGSSSNSPTSETSSPGSTGTSNPAGATSHSSKTGMIVGIVFGILAFVAICLALLIAYMRNRRRKRTDAFERQLMFRQMGSSLLVFGNRTSGASSEDGVGPDSNMIERGRGPNEPILSVYSQHSVPSQYSDSPSIFYTAVPRAIAAITSLVSTNAQPPPTPPPNMPLPPVPIPTARGNVLGLQADSTPTPPSGGSLSTLSLTSSSNSAPVPATAPPPLPQLAPGWVFPRNPEVRRSQLPPPKTDRQMDIHDRKVRLQGKLIGVQGWGNVYASDGERGEMEMLKEQIRRMEILENSEWALGRSDQFPAELSL
ncbi:hypothetical protein D9757_009853 [Collybiopsis confluens]|uniref:Uncharacterized protein n=1 Tax=Collybiopsis confluens TaxID=2823264 RepID=A0A8H5M2C1_9AGAR|nr:hypothetical protein D9757_009853 [Collybiopsis confluens]